MRKFTFTFALICTVAGAAFLGACSRNSDTTKCSGNGACCKDKAASGEVKTDAQATPAAGASGCSSKCNGGAKKVCPYTGATSN